MMTSSTTAQRGSAPRSCIEPRTC